MVYVMYESPTVHEQHLLVSLYVPSFMYTKMNNKLYELCISDLYMCET